jgi:hypothetical protein
MSPSTAAPPGISTATALGGAIESPYDEPDTVPEDLPVGLTKYVYIRGVGRVRYNRLSDEEVERYYQGDPDVRPIGERRIKPPPFSPPPSEPDAPFDPASGIEEEIL